MSAPTNRRTLQFEQLETKASPAALPLSAPPSLPPPPQEASVADNFARYLQLMLDNRHMHRDAPAQSAASWADHWLVAERPPAEVQDS